MKYSDLDATLDRNIAIDHREPEAVFHTKGAIATSRLLLVYVTFVLLVLVRFSWVNVISGL